MERIFFFARLLLSVAACWTVLPGSAGAAVTTQHGSSCKGLGLGDNLDLANDPGGIRNYNLSGRNLMATVICPVTRVGEVPVGGTFSVWVDGAPFGARPLTCTLQSYSYQGQFLGSAAFSVTGDRFDRLLSLPQSQVPRYSTQVVLCDIPPTGVILDIEPSF